MIEHPVTVEDLYVVQSFNDIRSATVADLVSALRAEGVLVVEKVDGRWPIEVIAGMAGSFYGCRDRGILLTDTFIEMLDALAEAQPFPPAGWHTNYNTGEPCNCGLKPCFVNPDDEPPIGGTDPSNGTS